MPRKHSLLNYCLILFFLILILVCALLLYVAIDLNYRYPETSRTSLYAGHNVLVLMPHEDDETGTLGGVLEEYVKAGSRVRIAFMTNGDGGKVAAETRFKEAIDALSICGIQEEDILFLGYGDQWQNGHIYNAAPSETVTSKRGFTKTYGAPFHDAVRAGIPYTRNNLKDDFRMIIESYLPDTIFCIDCDDHEDHRCTSLLFEEVMGDLLRDRDDYTPTVFKCFGYSLAWNAAPDFYRENILSTKNPYSSNYIKEMPCFIWEDRVRFPLSADALGRFQLQTTTFSMLNAYHSQSAILQSKSILNGDRVFWIRETESILYRADVDTSSGEKRLLTDYRLVDAPKDISKRYHDFVWIPNRGDLCPEISVSFSEPTNLSAVYFYDNPSIEDNILNLEIIFSDGSSIQTNALNQSGAATRICFEEKTGLTGFLVRILEKQGDYAGLTELEAYKKVPDHQINWIKLENDSDDFVYDYWIESGGNTEEFHIYAYPPRADKTDYYIMEDGDDGCSAKLDEDRICVVCPVGKRMTITVCDADNPTIRDSIEVSNPSHISRLIMSFFQKAERFFLVIKAKTL